MTEPHIQIGTTHLIIVQAGQVGLCTVDSSAHFLERGRHHINNARFTFAGFRLSTDEHINIGSKHRVSVVVAAAGVWGGSLGVSLRAWALTTAPPPHY